jgi:nucleoid-associated protein YgaU
MRKSRACLLVLSAACVACVMNGCSLMRAGASRDEMLPYVADTATLNAVAEPSPEMPPPAEAYAEAPAVASLTPGQAAPAKASQDKGRAVVSQSTNAHKAGGRIRAYTVQRGDTLMKIAFEVYGDLYQWRKIYEDNKTKIKDIASIPVGTILTIEEPAIPVEIARNGEKYLIQWGDTLSRISNKIYGTPKQWRKLWDNNRQLIKDPDKIYADFFLYYILSPDYQQQNQLTPAPLSDSQEAAPKPLVEKPGNSEQRAPAADKQ